MMGRTFFANENGRNDKNHTSVHYLLLPDAAQKAASYIKLEIRYPL